MSNINSVIIAGRLTKDAELRATKGGTPVLTFSVAVNESKHNKQTDEWDDVPSFFDVVLYGKRAESLSGFLTKGIKVTTQGRLSQRSWEKDGQKHSRIEIVASMVELPPRAAKKTDEHGLTQENYDALASIGAKPIENDLYAEDLPF